MNGLFLAAILPHALIIGSLSLAGLRTKTLPVLLIILGGFQAVAGALGAFALPQTFEQGPHFYATFGLSFLRLRPLVSGRIHRARSQIASGAFHWSRPRGTAVEESA